MLVLVGEQDNGYADLISELLRSRSHRVVLATTEDLFQQFVDRSTANLIIVNAGLLEGAIADTVRALSTSQAAPIMVLFDEVGPAEVAACLTAGADDCIRKPFHPNEFAARIEAIARRASRRADARVEPVAMAESSLPVSDRAGVGLEFDTTRKRASYNGVDLGCSELEYNILHLMAAVDGQVLSHAFLNSRVWGYPNLTDSTLLKGHVSSIRRKLKRAGFTGPVIRTIYGVGYSLAA